MRYALKWERKAIARSITVRPAAGRGVCVTFGSGRAGIARAGACGDRGVVADGDFGSTGPNVADAKAANAAM